MQRNDPPDPLVPQEFKPITTGIPFNIPEVRQRVDAQIGNFVDMSRSVEGPWIEMAKETARINNEAAEELERKYGPPVGAGREIFLSAIPGREGRGSYVDGDVPTGYYGVTEASLADLARTADMRENIYELKESYVKPGTADRFARQTVAAWAPGFMSYRNRFDRVNSVPEEPAAPGPDFTEYLPTLGFAPELALAGVAAVVNVPTTSAARILDAAQDVAEQYGTAPVRFVANALDFPYMPGWRLKKGQALTEGFARETRALLEEKALEEGGVPGATIAGTVVDAEALLTRAALAKISPAVPIAEAAADTSTKLAKAKAAYDVVYGDQSKVRPADIASVKKTAFSFIKEFGAHPLDSYGAAARDAVPDYFLSDTSTTPGRIGIAADIGSGIGTGAEAYMLSRYSGNDVRGSVQRTLSGAAETAISAFAKKANLHGVADQIFASLGGFTGNVIADNLKVGEEDAIAVLERLEEEFPGSLSSEEKAILEAAKDRVLRQRRTTP